MSSFDALGQLFHFQRNEFPDATTPPGRLLLDILDASKQGDFSSAPKLVEVFCEAPSLHTTLGALALLPFVTAHDDLLEMIAPLAAIARERGDLEWLCIALAESGLLDVADLAVDLYVENIAQLDDPDFPVALSVVLEDHPADLFYGPDMISETIDEYDRSKLRFDLRAYGDLAHARIAHARARNPGMCFFRGAPVNLSMTVSDILRALREQEPWRGASAFNDARARIEAFTGFDLSGCRHEHFDARIAVARLEELRSVVDLEAFAPGRRYFFGRPI